jgi:L-asparaginase II
MGPVLSMVLVGGWVESMHLTMQQGGDGAGRARVMERVGEQKSTLEHLVALTETQTGDSDVAALRNELLALLDIYDQLNVQRTAHSGKSASGRMVLGEDIKVDITEEKYKDLQQAIARLRAELTRPEDRTNA